MNPNHLHYPRAFNPMNFKSLTPKVGMGVILELDHKVLLGLRTGSHGSNQWGLPGGHMEVGETLLQCAQRELREEIDVFVTGIHKVGFSNNLFHDEGLHYVTLFVKAEWDHLQSVKLLEPDKCLEWKWFEPNDLPPNAFGSVKSLFQGCLWMGND